MPKDLQITQLQKFQNFVIFKIDNAKVNIDVFFQDETLWLIQKQIAELFEKVLCCINKSITSKMETTCKNFLQVQRLV